VSRDRAARGADDGRRSLPAAAACE